MHIYIYIYNIFLPSVNLTIETTIVCPVCEAKNAPNWQKKLAEALAKHLTSCDYNSSLQGIFSRSQV